VWLGPYEILPLGAEPAPLGVSPDGRRLAMARPPDEYDVTRDGKKLLWTALLKK
jgi:hypothetical protein